MDGVYRFAGRVLKVSNVTSVNKAEIHEPHPHGALCVSWLIECHARRSVDLP